MIDRLRAMDRNQWMSGLAVVALAVAAVPVYTLTRSPDLPDLGVVHGDPRELDDGYHHFVVAMDGTETAALVVDTRAAAGDPVEPAPAPAPVPTPAPTAAPAPATSSGAATSEVTVPEQNGQITPEALAGLGARGRVREITRRADGQLVAILEGPGTAAPAPTAAAPAPAPPAVAAPVPPPVPAGDGRAALLAVPGTRTVTVMSPGVYAVTTSATRDAFRAVPGVATVERDAIGIFASADPYYGYQWSLKNTGQTLGSEPDGGKGGAGVDIGVESAWKVTRGAGPLVAVVDGGMEITHPDLKNSLWSNPDENCTNGIDDDHNTYVDDCVGWDFVNRDKTVMDSGTINGVQVSNDHATHVAGIIAADADNGTGIAGIAPDATIMPLKVSNGSSMWMSDVALAVDYAVSEGADVVNLSLSSQAGTPYSQVIGLENAVKRAEAAGVLLVVAAGNDSANIDASGSQRYPANFAQPNVLTVGSSTAKETQSSFSAYGAASVDLHAPGSWIASSVPGAGYAYMSGTSMATPEVVGAAALVMAAHPELDSAGVKSLLMSSARRPASGAYNGRSVTGGRLDIGAALNPGGDGVSFRFDGLDTARPAAPLDVAVQAQVPEAIVPAGERVRYRATLLTQSGSQVYGVVGAPVTTPSGPAATGDDASVELGNAAGYAATAASVSLPVSFNLPAGRYALVAEAYAAGAGTTIGRPSVVYFAVSATNPTPTAPTTTAPGATTTTRPGATTTTRPGQSVTPTTAAGTPPTTAGGGTPTTTRPGNPGPTNPGATTPPTTTPGAPTTRPAGPLPTTAPTVPPTVPATTAPTTAAPGTPGPGGGGGGGGGSTTTRPATPTTGGPTTTVPTGPPVTTPPLPPVPPPVTANGITVNAVSPRYGSTAGGDRLVIMGAGFTGNLYVNIGGRAATFTATSANLLTVTTPAHAAGLVDIEVGRIGGGAAVYARSFDYRTPDPNTGTVPAPGSPAPTTTTTTRPTTTTTATTVPGSSGGPTPPVTRFTFGAEEQAANGLRLRPVTGGWNIAPVSTWPGVSCTGSSCAGTVL